MPTYEQRVYKHYRRNMREGIFATLGSAVCSLVGWSVPALLCLAMAGVFTILSVVSAGVFFNCTGRWPWQDDPGPGTGS